MSEWRRFYRDFICSTLYEAGQIREYALKKFSLYKVYPNSIQTCDGGRAFIVQDKSEKKLVISEKGDAYDEFEGLEESIGGKKLKVCSLSPENAFMLRRYFPYTVPEPVLGKEHTIGLGDRLGLATAGHISAIKEYDINPVFAQQSMRELKLTGRTYRNVLDDVCWSVFQEGYTGGFGADGDHLKNARDVLTALDSGFTMVTLDCSEHICGSIQVMSEDEIAQLYLQLPEDVRQKYESKYAQKQFHLADAEGLLFDVDSLKRAAVVYGNAVLFAKEIYNTCIKDCGRPVDFEISMDESLNATSPQAHFFVASELLDAGIPVGSIAPKFCGEFQKGIDYIGQTRLLEADIKIHAAIARTLGHKLSIHSGSDKFSIYPVIGRATEGRFHVKTAGTSWLEAVRVIARCSPLLFRDMYACTLGTLEDAKRYYRIGTDAGKLPDIGLQPDEKLAELLDLPDVRQAMHITYGHILNSGTDCSKRSRRDAVFCTLFMHEQDYCKALYLHIKRHVELLNCQVKKFCTDRKRLL